MRSRHLRERKKVWEAVSADDGDVLVGVKTNGRAHTQIGICADGNTQPKLNSAVVGGGISSPQNIIGTTNGAGNVKGVQCSSPSSGNLGAASISIYVNGGAAQTLTLSNTQVLLDSGSTYYTMYIPMNVRFTSSIRVSLAGNPSGPFVGCTVSWALD